MTQNKLSIIGDLRTIYNNMGNKEVTFKFPTGDFTYNVKPFLPYEDKKTIIDNSVDSGVDVDLATVLYKVDRGTINLVKEYLLVKYYTDIPVLEDILETHNLFAFTGLLKSVLENIDKEELEYINNAIEDGIEEFYRLQHMTNDIGYRLEGIVQTINGDLTKMTTQIEDIDLSGVDTKKFAEQIKKLPVQALPKN